MKIKQKKRNKKKTKPANTGKEIVKDKNNFTFRGTLGN